MKKILLILSLCFAVTACDDNLKRETPTNIENTIWQSTISIDDSTTSEYHLKFYTSTFDLLIQTYQYGELTQSSTKSGTYTYRVPKVTLSSSDGDVIYGMIMANTILLDFNISLSLIKGSTAF